MDLPTAKLSVVTAFMRAPDDFISEKKQDLYDQCHHNHIHWQGLSSVPSYGLQLVVIEVVIITNK